MQDTQINLLPEDRQHALRRGYFLRLGVVIIIFLILLTCVAAILLIPTYVYLTEGAYAKEMRLIEIESIASSTEDAEFSERLSTISDDSKILGILLEMPLVSKTLSSILAIPRPGITLSGFSYSPTADKNSNTIAISGMSATRDALRNYQLALQGTPSIIFANLPVSVYAKDSNIDFTITIKFVPTAVVQFQSATKTTQ